MLMAEVLVSYLGICVAGYDYEGQGKLCGTK